jgi:hypothetical protein
MIQHPTSWVRWLTGLHFPPAAITSCAGDCMQESASSKEVNASNGYPRRSIVIPPRVRIGQFPDQAARMLFCHPSRITLSPAIRTIGRIPISTCEELLPPAGIGLISITLTTVDVGVTAVSSKPDCGDRSAAALLAGLASTPCRRPIRRRTSHLLHGGLSARKSASCRLSTQCGLRHRRLRLLSFGCCARSTRPPA